MTYLASRKRPNYPNSIRFYAITPFWDKATKTQKQKQEYLGNLCTKGGLCTIISMIIKSVNMKIKAPSFVDLFAETSPQLGGAGRTKFFETLDRIIPWQDLKSLIRP